MKYLIFVIVLTFNSILLCQSKEVQSDTIYIESNQEFIDIITLNQLEKIQILNQNIQQRIDSAYLISQNFNNNNLHPESMFFELFTDTCGLVFECNFIEKSSSDNIIQFADEIETIIVSSNWKIANHAFLPDTVLYNNHFPLILYFDIDSKKLYFESENQQEYKTVFAINKEDNAFFFSGFEFICPP